MQFRTVTQATEYLYSFIAKNLRYKHTGAQGLEKMRYFLSLLNNPQDKVKTIHVAGTSGKGSTCYTVSLLLKAHGFSVGLYVKPHIKDIRERFQINNMFISDEEFLSYVNQLSKSITLLSQSPYGAPNYTEVVTALAFLVFADKKVDYTVIETLMGGRLDYTNTISRHDKLAIITRIGFDHTKILGNTLSRIALQKAGIFMKNGSAITLRQKKYAHAVVLAEAKKQKTALSVISTPQNYKNVKQQADGIMFDFHFQSLALPALFVSLHGTFQAENVSLAIAAVCQLSGRDRFTLQPQIIRSSLQNAAFAARFEVRKIKNKIVVLDGAHNPQKMKAFLTALTKQYPNQPFDFLLSFLQDKDSRKMISYITPYAKTITLTSFFHERQEWLKKSEELATMRSHFPKNMPVSVIPDKIAALQQAFAKTDKILVITGSMYFVSEIYKAVESL